MDKSLESGSIGWMIHNGIRTIEETIRYQVDYATFENKTRGKRAGVDNNEEWIQRIWVHLHLHVAKDNRTWRRNVAIINNWQKSLTGNMIDIKNNMSHMKYHGFSMVLRGDEITIVRTSTLQVESGIWSGSKLSPFELVNYDQLKEIIIEDNYFEKVIKYKLGHLTRLKKLVVGKKSFTRGEFVNKTYYTNMNYIITNGPLLTLIDIGECSFVEYDGERKMSDWRNWRSWE